MSNPIVIIQSYISVLGNNTRRWLVELEVLVDVAHKGEGCDEADGAEHEEEDQAGHHDEAEELCCLQISRVSANQILEFMYACLQYAYMHYLKRLASMSIKFI